MSDNLLAEYGVYPVQRTDPPQVTIYQRAVEIEPVLHDGQWMQQWSIEAAAVPQTVTPRQVRLLLLSQNMLDQVETMIAAQDRATQITWEFAIEFRRDDPLLLALAANPALNLTEEQLDQFFIAASQL